VLEYKGTQPGESRKRETGQGGEINVDDPVTKKGSNLWNELGGGERHHTKGEAKTRA